MATETEEIRNFLNTWSANGQDGNANETATDDDDGVVLRRSKNNSSNGYNYEQSTVYSLKPEDIEADVFDFLYSFLETKKCPYSLAVWLASTVAREMAADVNHNETFQNGNGESDSYFSKSIKSDELFSRSMNKLNEQCSKFKSEVEEAIKSSSVHSTSKLFVTSICAIRNGRRKMEDRHIVIHNLNALFDIKSNKQYSYFAIFDGHAGIDAATYTAAHLHVNLVNSKRFQSDDIPGAIREAFSVTDLNYLERCVREGSKCGTTAIVCLFENREKLYIGWVGDSLAYLMKNDKPIDVTYAHRPDNVDERERVVEMGGTVSCTDTWRVNGSLSVTRAIGDPEFKPAISSDAEVKEVALDGEEDFLVIACDGLWDHITPEEAVDITYKKLLAVDADEVKSLTDAVSQELAETAKSEGSSDNITVIVVFLRDLTELKKRAVNWLEAKASNNQLDAMNSNSMLNPFASPFVPFGIKMDSNENLTNPFSTEPPTPTIDELTLSKDNYFNKSSNDMSERDINANGIINNVSENQTKTEDSYCLLDESLIENSVQDVAPHNNELEQYSSVNETVKVTNGQVEKPDHDHIQDNPFSDSENQSNFFSNSSKQDIIENQSYNQSSFSESDASFFSFKNEDSKKQETTMSSASTNQFESNFILETEITETPVEPLLTTMVEDQLLRCHIVEGGDVKTEQPDLIGTNELIKEAVDKEISFLDNQQEQSDPQEAMITDEFSKISELPSELEKPNDLIDDASSLDDEVIIHHDGDENVNEPIAEEVNLLNTSETRSGYESIQYEYNVLDSFTSSSNKLPVITESEKVAIIEEQQEESVAQENVQLNEVPQVSHEEEEIQEPETMPILSTTEITQNEIVEVVEEAAVPDENITQNVFINEVLESIDQQPSCLEMTSPPEIKPFVIDQVIADVQPSFVVETGIAPVTTPDTSDADTEKDLDWKFMKNNDEPELNAEKLLNYESDQIIEPNNTGPEPEPETEKVDDIVVPIVPSPPAQPITDEKVEPIIAEMKTDEQSAVCQGVEPKSEAVKEESETKVVAASKPKTLVKTSNVKPRSSMGGGLIKSTASTKVTTTTTTTTAAPKTSTATTRSLAAVRAKSTSAVTQRPSTKPITKTTSVTADLKPNDKPRVSKSTLLKSTVPPTTSAPMRKSLGTSRSVAPTAAPKGVLKAEVKPTEKTEIKEVRKSLTSRPIPSTRASLPAPGKPRVPGKLEESKANTTVSAAASKPKPSTTSTTRLVGLTKPPTSRLATTKTTTTTAKLTAKTDTTDAAKKTETSGPKTTARVPLTRTTLPKTTAKTSVSSAATSTLKSKPSPKPSTNLAKTSPTTKTTAAAAASPKTRPVSRVAPKSATPKKVAGANEKGDVNASTVTSASESVTTLETKPTAIISERISKRDKLSSSSLKDELEAAMVLETPINTAGENINGNHANINGISVEESLVQP